LKGLVAAALLLFGVVLIYSSFNPGLTTHHGWMLKRVVEGTDSDGNPYNTVKVRVGNEVFDAQGDDLYNATADASFPIPVIVQMDNSQSLHGVRYEGKWFAFGMPLGVGIAFGLAAIGIAMLLAWPMIRRPDRAKKPETAIRHSPTTEWWGLDREEISDAGQVQP
jgi:hypothetical protein